MKIIILFSAIVAMALAVPVPGALGDDADTSIISFQNTNHGLGTYNFAYETSDGSKRKEESLLINTNDPENQTLVVKGSYSFIAPDGITYTVNYIADENGYRIEKN